MTKEKRKKIGIIGVCAFLAVCLLNGLTLQLEIINVLALLAFIAVAFVATALYVRDNGPLSKREMLKEMSPILLILLVLMVVIFGTMPK